MDRYENFEETCHLKKRFHRPPSGTHYRRGIPACSASVGDDGMSDDGGLPWCLSAYLADVFENFRKICLATQDLNPARYYSAPGLAWDAALKSTQLKLDAERGYILEVD